MARKTTGESDSAYFLKILLYVVLGMIWLQYDGRTVFPLGLLVGLAMAQHERFRIDRKIEYAVILIAALVAAVSGKGFFLNLTALTF